MKNLFKKVGGLNSKTLWVLGPGYAKEDFKMTALEMGIPFRSDLWCAYADFLARFVPEFQVSQMLEADARISLLKRIFRSPDAQRVLPELMRISKRPRFFEHLDRTLQEGRENFPCEEDVRVVSDFLEEHSRPRPIRTEFFLLDLMWNQTIQSLDLWDLPRLKREALQRFSSDSVTELGICEVVWVFTKKKSLLDQAIQERVQKTFSVTDWDLENTSEFQWNNPVWNRSHSFADALEFLVDEIESEIRQNRQVHLLIQDSKEVRSGVARSLKRRGIPLQDPRNPRAAIEEESLKYWIQSLRVVAFNFSLSEVKSFLSFSGTLSVDQIRLWVDQHSARWSRDFAFSHPGLKALLEPLLPPKNGRMGFHEFSEYAQAVASRTIDPRPGLFAGVQRIFQSWQKSLEQTGDLYFRRFLFQWLADLEERLEKANIPAEPFRYPGGVHLYRVDQAPSPRVRLMEEDQTSVLLCFGVTPDFFRVSHSHLLWFDRRDRDRLSFEMGWMSEQTLSEDRVSLFQSWIGAKSFRGFGWKYGPDGKECEGIETLFPQFLIQDLGSHPRYQASLQGAQSLVRPQFSRISLPRKIGISGFSDYLTCSFRGVSSQILKLDNEREIQFDFQADQLGKLVHQVLEIYLKENRPTAEILDEIWDQYTSMWIQFSERALKMQRKRILAMLSHFESNEAEYRERAGDKIKVASLEHPLEWERAGITFKGRIDRMDQHEDGFLIFDYKTSQVFANAYHFIDSGREGQILIYASILQQQLQSRAIAGVYVQLKKNGCERTKGFVFREYAKGTKKEPAKHTIFPLTGASQSLVKEGQEEYWSKVFQRIDLGISNWNQGVLDANPENPKNCDRCRYQEVCGESRLQNSADIPVESGS